MPRRASLTAADLRAVFDAGDSVAQIAVRSGSSERNVRHVAGRNGVTLPRARHRTVAEQRLTDVEWLRAARAVGRSRSAIAAELGVDVREVDEALRAAGLDTAPLRRSDSRLYDEQWMRAHVEAGDTSTTIAAELGCARWTVTSMMHHYKIPVPSRSSPSRFPQLTYEAWLVEQLRTRTAAAIAAVGCSPSRVAQAKVRFGLQSSRRRPRRPPPQVLRGGRAPKLSDYRWLLVQRSLGRSVHDIASEVGLCDRAVRESLERFGLETGSMPFERRVRLDWETRPAVSRVARLNSISIGHARSLLREIGALEQ